MQVAVQTNGPHLQVKSDQQILPKNKNFNLQNALTKYEGEHCGLLGLEGWEWDGKLIFRVIHLQKSTILCDPLYG